MKYDFTKLLSYRIIHTEVYVKRKLLECFANLEYDITFEQWTVLSVLYNQPGLIQSEIATITSKDKTNITRILDVLQKKGYLERTIAVHDRRSYAIYLTTEGNTLVKELIPHIAAVNDSFRKDITDRQFEDFLYVLGIMGQLEEKTVDSSRMEDA